MVQFKIFTGTIAAIEAAFNTWAASLPNGVNVNAGPITPATPSATGPLAEREYLKEVMYVLPLRSGNGIDVARSRLPGKL